jgi:hypothetical protein
MNLRDQPVTAEMVMRDPAIKDKWIALEKAIGELAPDYYSMWQNGQTVSEHVADQVALAALKAAGDGKVN